MRRRAFIAALGGVAAWPLVVRAQQRERVRRIGVLANLSADDPEAMSRLVAFVQRLERLGWIDGQNIRIDLRWGAGDPGRVRRYAAELVGLRPGVILSAGSTNLRELQQATQSVPIVFVTVTDPVGAGFVASLAHPGGNITGFAQFEYGISAKWVELLKQIAPAVTRVVVLRNPMQASGIGQLGALSSVASAFSVELHPVDIRNAGEIERVMNSMAHRVGAGLIVTSSALAAVNRDLIITLAAEHRLPAVYFRRFFVTAGGLISYGPDTTDQFRQAADYVHRILKGEKAADLPVQTPTKYELVINLKTAKALGLEVPATLLARADEVIE